MVVAAGDNVLNRACHRIEHCEHARVVGSGDQVRTTVAVEVGDAENFGIRTPADVLFKGEGVVCCALHEDTSSNGHIHATIAVEIGNEDMGDAVAGLGIGADQPRGRKGAITVALDPIDLSIRCEHVVELAVAIDVGDCRGARLQILDAGLSHGRVGRDDRPALECAVAIALEEKDAFLAADEHQVGFAVTVEVPDHQSIFPVKLAIGSAQLDR